MIRHLLLHYALTLIGVIFILLFLPLFAGVGSLTLSGLGRAMVWGGFATPVILYVEFAAGQTWPLFDNLRISRFRTLGLLTLGVECTGITLVTLA